MKELRVILEIGIDPHVHDVQIDAVMAAQYIDGRSTPKKVFHHLSGHFGREGGYPFFSNCRGRRRIRRGPFCPGGG